MKEHDLDIFKVATGFVVAYFLGISLAIKALFWFMAVDFITGLGAGIINKKLSSDIGRDGLIRKGMVLIVCLSSSELAKLNNLSFDPGAGTAIAFVFMEWVSIFENLARAGIWLPRQMVEGLAKAKKELLIDPRTAETIIHQDVSVKTTIESQNLTVVSEIVAVPEAQAK